MNNTPIKIGDRVKITQQVHMPMYMTFEAGHEFTVYDSSHRGLDLKDDEGNCLDETLFINSIIEKI